MAYTSRKDAQREDAAKALAELKDRLRTGDTAGVYLFSGEEDYLKRHYFRELCRSAGESVNVAVLSGPLDFGEFCDAYSSVPMQEFSLFGDEPSAPSKRVIKLEDPDLSKLSTSEQAEFFRMLEDTGDGVIVVVYLSGADAPKGKSAAAAAKRLAEFALPCRFLREEPGSPVLLRWLKKHFDKEKITALPDVLRYLAESVGSDMSLLSLETEKLTAYLFHEGRNGLTKDDVDLVCTKNAEAVTFDVTNALIAGNFEAAVSSLARLRAMKTEPLLIFGAIAKTAADLGAVSALSKAGKSPAEIGTETALRDFVVRKYLSTLRARGDDYPKTLARLCLEADETLKSRATDGYRLLETLLFKAII